MNKKFISIIWGISLIIVMAITWHHGNDKTLSELELKNIEALSQYEIPGKEIRDEYCLPLEDFICTVFWRIGTGELNSTSYYGYLAK